jgi:hypothetical protein|nr:MAG TPA: protein of unknown function (DUF4748) [Bacteriophage sp.]
MDWINFFSDLSVSVAVIACAFYFINKETDKNREERLKMEEEHKAEVDKLSETINNNTVVMNQILEVLRKDNGDDLK